MTLYTRIVDTLIRKRHQSYNTGRKKSFHIDTPVISTGSLTLGGAGKTPLTHYITGLLQKQGLSVSILSRGYGRKSKGIREVRLSGNTHTEALWCGDEPVMLKTRLPSVPVIVSEDRYSGARYIEKHHHPDVIVLDDGFQHRRLHHDKDILIFKNDFKGSAATYYPFGDLRDSLSRLKEADLIFLEEGTSRDVIQFLSSQTALIPYQLTYSLDKPVGNTHKICAFCGIARPERFHRTLNELNIHTDKYITFRDHVHYTPHRLHTLKKTKCDIYITTLKDYVKLPKTFLQKHSVLTINMEIVPDKDSEKLIVETLII